MWNSFRHTGQRYQSKAHSRALSIIRNRMPMYSRYYNNSDRRAAACLGSSVNFRVLQSKYSMVLKPYAYWLDRLWNFPMPFGWQWFDLILHQQKYYNPLYW